jgi:Do/DeqQ family serine protease
MKIKNLVLVFLSALFGAGIALLSYDLLQPRKELVQVEPSQAPILKAVSYASNQETFNFTNASSIATPAVVHVNTTYNYDTEQLKEFHDDDLFEYFFGQPKQAPHQSKGSGSGVIISKDGYVVTNNHVVESSSEIAVTLSNNETYKAKLIGTDKDTDLALLKIEAENLPFLYFANSDQVLVGEWVLAVGNPFNLASTVTAGIVSAKGRNINLLENIQGKSNTAIESFIQTDAAINPGNSGGALVNLEGKVIGINTAIATPTGTYAGYAFAVPSNIASKVVSDLKEFGAVQRAFIGVNIISVDSKIAESLKLKEPKGVYLQNIMKGGAADVAGLENEDVILSINDTKVNDIAALQEKIASFRPGNVIKLSFLRKNVLLFATLTLKNRFNNQELLTKDDDIPSNEK